MNQRKLYLTLLCVHLDHHVKSFFQYSCILQFTFELTFLSYTKGRNKHLSAYFNYGSCFSLHNTISFKNAKVLFRVMTKDASVLSALTSTGFNDLFYSITTELCFSKGVTESGNFRFFLILRKKNESVKVTFYCFMNLFSSVSYCLFQYSSILQFICLLTFITFIKRGNK